MMTYIQLRKCFEFSRIMTTVKENEGKNIFKAELGVTVKLESLHPKIEQRVLHFVTFDISMCTQNMLKKNVKLEPKSNTSQYRYRSHKS